MNKLNFLLVSVATVGMIFLGPKKVNAQEKACQVESKSDTLWYDKAHKQPAIVLAQESSYALRPDGSVDSTDGYQKIAAIFFNNFGDQLSRMGALLLQTPKTTSLYTKIDGVLDKKIAPAGGG